MKKKIKTYSRKWELCAQGTDRMKVPGGWLIRSWFNSGIGITFVPDPKHTWIFQEKEEKNDETKN